MTLEKLQFFFWLWDLFFFVRAVCFSFPIELFGVLKESKEFLDGKLLWWEERYCEIEFRPMVVNRRSHKRIPIWEHQLGVCVYKMREMWIHRELIESRSFLSTHQIPVDCKPLLLTHRIVWSCSETTLTE